MIARVAAGAGNAARAGDRTVETAGAGVRAVDRGVGGEREGVGDGVGEAAGGTGERNLRQGGASGAERDSRAGKVDVHRATGGAVQIELVGRDRSGGINVDVDRAGVERLTGEEADARRRAACGDDGGIPVRSGAPEQRGGGGGVGEGDRLGDGGVVAERALLGIGEAVVVGVGRVGGVAAVGGGAEPGEAPLVVSG